MSERDLSSRIAGASDAHLLTEASAFRERLGNWPEAPAGAPHWRLCLDPAQATGPFDIAWDALVLPSGAGAALAVDEGVTALVIERQHYRFAGERPEDWMAALLAYLDCGFEPPDALCAALAASRPTAWPAGLNALPRIDGLPSFTAAFPACQAPLGLYPVVPDVSWIERLLELGVTTVQLRIKTPGPDLHEQIGRAIEAGQRHGAQVFINDHWREAIELGAYGVHLGQEDLHVADLDAIAAAGLRLGLSTHGFYEMRVAEHFRPSYMALGAVFATSTKEMATAPLGLQRLARYVDTIAGAYPTVAIGGIDLTALPSVLSTGVDSAAVVRAVTDADDLAASVASLQACFGT